MTIDWLSWWFGFISAFAVLGVFFMFMAMRAAIAEGKEKR